MQEFLRNAIESVLDMELFRAEEAFERQDAVGLDGLRQRARMALADEISADLDAEDDKSQGDQWGSVLVLEERSDLWDQARWNYTAASRAESALDWIS